MPLFHRNLGFPKHISLPKGLFKLIWSNHAIQATENDRYGNIVRVDGISIDPYRIFEIELCQENANIIKFCYRSRYNSVFDISYVFHFEGRSLFVKTVWLNKKDDNHKTLDRSKYNA